MKSALILYPHQLFPLEQLPGVDAVLMVEDPLFFGIDRQQPIKLHKQKLILHRASMRRYVEEVLWPAGMEVDYVELDGLLTSEDIFERAKKFDQLYVFDTIDDALTKRLLEARRANNTISSFEFLTSPNFYLKNQEIQSYFDEDNKHSFDDFYQWQRERFNVLIGDDYKPVGGKWMIEQGAKKLKADIQLPSFPVYGSNKFVDEAVKYVEAHFPENPGTTDFVWPTSHAEAEEWLNNFITGRLEHYAEFQSAVDSKAMWLYHSAISSSLQVGLLSPKQVVDKVLHAHSKKPIPLASLEAFIRGVLGWREFARARYLVEGRAMRTSNELKQQRRLTNDWYMGSTGVAPFDGLVQKLLSHGYVSQSERATIAVNLMILSDINPQDMHRFFMKLCIDDYDWVVTPNLYWATSFIARGASADEVPICSSEAILEKSNYEKGEWCDTWDGLYWRFVEGHKDKLKNMPSMRSAVQKLEKLDPDHRRIVGYRAEDFINKYTG